jgi:UDP-glucose 4-epimerase
MDAAKSVLVTGATGYVGPFVLQRLRDAGYRVRALVRHAQTHREADADFVEVGDFSDCVDFRPYLGNCDAIIHLAGRAHVFHERDPNPELAYRRANTLITQNLAAAAAQAGVRRFVFMSTVKVYGEQSTYSLSEADVPEPNDAYGRSKRDAELALAQIASGSKMEFTIVRSPMVYGPNCKGNIRRLVKLISHGVPLPLGSIANQRTIIGVTNLADILERCVHHHGAANETFVIGDGEPVSTRDMVDWLAVGLDRHPRYFPVAVSLLNLAGRLTGREAEVQRLTESLTFDIRKLRGHLSWHPLKTTKEGMIEAGRSFRSKRAAETTA